MSKWRTFEHFPKNKECPICGSNHDEECVLIAIQGTNDGKISEATPVHSRCINPVKMIHNKEIGMIYFMTIEGCGR